MVSPTPQRCASREYKCTSCVVCDVLIASAFPSNRALLSRLLVVFLGRIPRLLATQNVGTFSVPSVVPPFTGTLGHIQHCPIPAYGPTPSGATLAMTQFMCFLHDTVRDKSCLISVVRASHLCVLRPPIQALFQPLGWPRRGCGKASRAETSGETC